MSLIHAVVTITFRVDHVVSGVAINVFTIGLSRFLCQSFFGAETQSKLNPYLFPKLLGVNSLAFWLIPVVVIAWFVLYKTVFGLRLRSVGENPEAADTLGVNVIADALRGRAHQRRAVRHRLRHAVRRQVDHRAWWRAAASSRLPR